MTTLVLPAPVVEVPDLESTSARASTLATNLRAVVANVKDPQAWAERGALADWQGDAREAASHGMTRFGRRLGVAEAALEDAAVATDRFEDRLLRLERRRTDLEGERTDVNRDVEALRVLALAATDDLGPLQDEARRLRERATDAGQAIRQWWDDVVAAESDYVAALRSVDTVAEARQSAADPGRPAPDRLLRDLDDREGDPAAVNRWWESLTRAEQQALLMEHPEVVGNTDGIPVRDRDEANRTSLYSDLDRWEQRDADGQLSDDERDQMANANAVRDALDEYRERVDLVTGDHLANLIVYQPGLHSGDGGVALSLGDPDLADHVSTYVPGTTSEVSGIGGSLDAVEDLHDSALAENNGSVSTMVWLDYDAPSADSLTDLDELGDLGTVVTSGEAQRGGDRLADFVDGLRASDEGDPAHLSVVGHSYGATTAAHAAGGGADIDDLVLLGSPGAPTSSADALTVADVWVGAADHDPVSLLGLGSGGGVGTLGYDPAQESFGGNRFEVDPGSYRVQDLIANHSSYFEDESLDNISAIVTGGDPTADDGRDGGEQSLTELVAGSSAVSGGEQLWEGGKWVGETVWDGLGDRFGW